MPPTSATMLDAEAIAAALGGHREGNGWRARCPVHDGKSDTSLSLTDGDGGKVLVKCFAGCESSAVIAALKERGLWPSGGGGAISPSVNEVAGCSLAILAEAKKLPVEFLRSLGLSDYRYQKQPSVRIPYLDAGSTEVAVRFRLALEGRRRFVWRGGDKVRLYGLERLAEIRKTGWVLLVEGESDCWTAWHYGIPALGIPGKSTWQRPWASLLASIDVYLWREPGADDLVAKVAADVPGLRVIAAPEDVKDISQAHVDSHDVLSLIGRLKAEAVPAETLHREQAATNLGELRRLAAPVLAAADPLPLVERAIRDQGYGGDIRPAVITYLATSSRVLAMRPGAMPVHLLLAGVAGSGKSFTLSTVLRLLPDCAYAEVDAGSPKILIYSRRLQDLKHRVIVFGEADSLPAGEDNPAASAVRNLLQEHRLRYEATIRDAETGEFTTKEVDKEGPTVLITTAIRRLGPQLDSRLFTLDVPDDNDQIRQALATQGAIEIDGTGAPDGALLAYQGLLQGLAPWDVVVPFAPQLAEVIGRSPSAPRILRDYQRLLSLVKTVAVLRHTHRGRDESGRLVAEVEDYATIFDLVGDMYQSSVSGGASAAVRATVAAVARLRAEGVERITMTELAGKLRLTHQATSKRVATARRLRWLVNQETRRGHPADLDIGEPLPDVSGLPAPGALTNLQPATAFTDEDTAPPLQGADTTEPPPSEPHYACGGVAWWWRAVSDDDGDWLCATCVQPPDGVPVVERAVEPPDRVKRSPLVREAVRLGATVEGQAERGDDAVEQAISDLLEV